MDVMDIFPVFDDEWQSFDGFAYWLWEVSEEICSTCWGSHACDLPVGHNSFHWCSCGSVPELIDGVETFEV